MYRIITTWILLSFSFVFGIEKFTLCVPRNEAGTIASPEQPNSRIRYLTVTDSAECAIKLHNGKADFGIFTAEELLLVHQFYPSDIVPIYELRPPHKDNEDFQFQTVALFKNESIQEKNENFDFIRNVGICLPDSDSVQTWSDYILKYFERTITDLQCGLNVSTVENEIQNLRMFYGKACRPGNWVQDREYNDQLRKKYPELCSLCDNPPTCSYNDRTDYFGALNCLTSGRGKIAYVELSHFRQYMMNNNLLPESNTNSIRFLCPDATTQDISTEKPCAWIKQPWNVIAARKSISIELFHKINAWADKTRSSSWMSNLITFLQKTGQIKELNVTSTAEYLNRGREIDISKNSTTCSKPLKWCTINIMENNKCKWVANAALVLGIEPAIHCHLASTVFQCFRDIMAKEADLMMIDSNYGYLARKVYGLSTIFYCESSNRDNTHIVAMVKNPTSFENLKNRSACFPEYNGLSWLSFNHFARSINLFKSKSCISSTRVAEFFSGACTPGIRDDGHRILRTNPKVSTVLCSQCFSENKYSDTCMANANNTFYGDQGAFECLKSKGDVAFVDLKNVFVDDYYSQRIQILCKNNSLVEYTESFYDKNCALSTIVNSEIEKDVTLKNSVHHITWTLELHNLSVVRIIFICKDRIMFPSIQIISRNDDSKTTIENMKNVLSKLEDWLHRRKNSSQMIQIFGKFNDTSNLLFKDSTVGLRMDFSNMRSILEYEQLLQNNMTCSSARSSQIIYYKYIIFSLLCTVTVLNYNLLNYL